MKSFSNRLRWLGRGFSLAFHIFVLVKGSSAWSMNFFSGSNQAKSSKIELSKFKPISANSDDSITDNFVADDFSTDDSSSTLSSSSTQTFRTIDDWEVNTEWGGDESGHEEGIFNLDEGEDEEIESLIHSAYEMHYQERLKKYPWLPKTQTHFGRSAEFKNSSSEKFSQSKSLFKAPRIRRFKTVRSDELQIKAVLTQTKMKEDKLLSLCLESQSKRSSQSKSASLQSCQINVNDGGKGSKGSSSQIQFDLIEFRESPEIQRVLFGAYEMGDPQADALVRKLYEIGEPLVVQYLNQRNTQWELEQEVMDLQDLFEDMDDSEIQESLVNDSIPMRIALFRILEESSYSSQKSKRSYRFLVQLLNQGDSYVWKRIQDREDSEVRAFFGVGGNDLLREIENWASLRDDAREILSGMSD